MSGVIQIDRATPADFDAVSALLTDHRLPVVGLREHFDHAMVARLNGEVIGTAALEVCPSDPAGQGSSYTSTARTPTKGAPTLTHQFSNRALNDVGRAS